MRALLNKVDDYGATSARLRSELNSLGASYSLMEKKYNQSALEVKRLENSGEEVIMAHVERVHLMMMHHQRKDFQTGFSTLKLILEKRIILEAAGVIRTWYVAMSFVIQEDLRQQLKSIMSRRANDAIRKSGVKLLSYLVRQMFECSKRGLINTWKRSLKAAIEKNYQERQINFRLKEIN